MDNLVTQKIVLSGIFFSLYTTYPAKCDDSHSDDGLANFILCEIENWIDREDLQIVRRSLIS